MLTQILSGEKRSIMFEGLIVTEREMKYATLDTESLAYSYPLKNIQIKTFYT